MTESLHRDCLRCTVLQVEEPVLLVSLQEDENPYTLSLDATTTYLLHTAWKGATLHLLEASMDRINKQLSAAIIVLQPDYLLNVTAVAGCFKDYGAHPLHFLYRMLDLAVPSSYILLGNTVGRFFDHAVRGEQCDYKSALIEAFREDALNFLAAPEDELRRIYFDTIASHFQNIQQIVEKNRLSFNHRESSEQALLEPLFVSPELGLLGRLDYLCMDAEGNVEVIELKSGKRDDYRGISKREHYVQMLLYAEILHRSLHKNPSQIKGGLLYSRYPILSQEALSTGTICEAIEIRNRIIALLHHIAAGNDISSFFSYEAIDSVSSSTGKLWCHFERPRMLEQTQRIMQADEQSRQWIFEQLRHICREEELARIGILPHLAEGRGHSSLWLNSFMEKVAEGTIIAPLHLCLDATSVHNLLKDSLSHSVQELHLNVGECDAPSVPNFRIGDEVMLYSCPDFYTQPSEQILSRGVITDIASEHIVIALRQPMEPHRLDALKNIPLAIEHDVIGTSAASVAGPIFSILSAPERRRALLIGDALPEIAKSEKIEEISKLLHKDCKTDNYAPSEETIYLMAQMLASPEYFLLVGPPGTGKTSIVLRNAVRHLYNHTSERILLVAFTHRAVDEICSSLESIKGIDYLRLGRSSHCPEAFHHRLMEKRIEGISSRNELRSLLATQRIVVGTVSLLSMQSALFRIFGDFDTIICDEASQLLDYQVAPLLTRARRFFLIGDHKQLPAVSLQPEVDSLFYKLYKRVYSNRKDVTGTLSHQGRMHPEIATLSNELFYENHLKPIPLPHQLIPSTSPRCRFVDVVPLRQNGAKYNEAEAESCAQIVKQIIQQIKLEGSPFTTQSIGIIVPYRSQIATILAALQNIGLEREARLINIDTVERYQGSQRDHIIYSATISTPFQLERIAMPCQMEGGVSVDRKLNVIITRARLSLHIVGWRELLTKNYIYQQLIERIEGK